MTTEHNELVGLQAIFSKVVPRYSLTHLYRWRRDGRTAASGSMRGYDMHRQRPIGLITRSLRGAYAPAILSVWRQETDTAFTEYLQFEIGVTPAELGLPGAWEHWAQL